MRRVSCPSRSKAAACLALLLPAALLPAAAGQGEAQANAAPAAVRAAKVEPLSQRPLPALSGERALVFVGGFGDEVHGIMSHLEAMAPAFVPGQVERRGYYQWNGGDPAAQHAPAPIVADIRAFLRVNPQAEVVLIGHSLGAATALRALQELKAEEGRFCLLTLDPVDSSTPPERPASVAWWGNAWLSHSQSKRDFLFALGGRWNACAGADVNLHFDGRRPTSWGRLPIHDDAAGFLLARPAGAAASLLESWQAARSQRQKP